MQLAITRWFPTGQTRAAWTWLLSHVGSQQVLPVPRVDACTHVLDKHGNLVLSQPRGRVLECLHGCLWITLDGQMRDVILEGGQCFCPDSDRRVLVHALAPSRVRVVHVASVSSADHAPG